MSQVPSQYHKDAGRARRSRGKDAAGWKCSSLGRVAQPSYFSSLFLGWESFLSAVVASRMSQNLLSSIGVTPAGLSHVSSQLFAWNRKFPRENPTRGQRLHALSALSCARHLKASLCCSLLSWSWPWLKHRILSSEKVTYQPLQPWAQPLWERSWLSNSFIPCARRCKYLGPEIDDFMQVSEPFWNHWIAWEFLDGDISSGSLYWTYLFSQGLANVTITVSLSLQYFGDSLERLAAVMVLFGTEI